MASEWREYALGDLIDVKHGFAFPGDFIYVEPRGDVLLTPGNFAIGGGFKGDKFKYYDGPVPGDFALAEGDLLVTMTDLSKQSDTLGYPAFVPLQPDGRRFLHNQRLGKVLIKDTRIVDMSFLNYLLRSESYRNEVLASATGTTVKHTSPQRIARFKFSAPPLFEQRAIARVLAKLDDKIDMNRRMNKTLEAMARALFKSWFVELDPIRAKAAALIRDGILEIGDGYRAKNSELGKPGLPFIRAGNLSDGLNTQGAEVLHRDSVTKAGRKLSLPGDVAFTSKGTIGRFARVNGSTQQFVYSPQVCFWRSLDRERLQPSVLYYWMQSEDMKQQIEAVADQTDMAPYVSLRDQRNMDVPIFPESQGILAQRLDVYLDRQALAAEESRTLQVLRDTLLPKLITGELRVSRAQVALARIGDG